MICILRNDVKINYECFSLYYKKNKCTNDLKLAKYISYALKNMNNFYA